MKQTIIVLGGLLLVLGLACHAHIGVGVGVYSPEETAYLGRAMNTSLTFVIPEAKAEEAWTRIKDFIGEYSTMKIQSVTDRSIETVRPTKPGEYGYTASRVSAEGGQTFAVTCYCHESDKENAEAVSRNAHILARYAQTGEVRPRLIAR